MTHTLRVAASLAAASLLGLTLQAGPPVSTTPTVAVSPATYTMRISTSTTTVSKTFYASVSNLSVKTVTWWVNGIAGGNSSVGTITTAGVYTTPKALPANNVIKIRAHSSTNPAIYGEAVVTLQNPVPSLSTVTPNAVNIGTFTVVLKGTGFVPSSRILLGGSAVATTFVSDTGLKLTLTDNTARSTDIGVVNPDPGTVTSNKKSFTIMPPVSLNLTPATATVRIGATRQFYGSVSNSLDRTVTWYVNDVKGGNAVNGTISETGIYTPPAILPPAPASTTPATTAPAITVTIKAVSNAANTITDTSLVTLQNAIPSITSVTPASAVIGTTGTFTILGTGFANGITGRLGSTELTITSITSTRVTATATIKGGIGGVVPIGVINPNPGTAPSNVKIITTGPAQQVLTSQAASKFLQRASWGPTPDTIAHLQEVGINRWLDEQLAAPVSDLPEPIADTTSISPAQRTFYRNAIHGPDQLRQRMGFALSQILVVSGVKTPQSHQLVPYMRMLNRGAFGNYFTLLKGVTLSPTMGRFLDMVNNQKENPARGIEPNENYGRELLQLFTVGLTQLNMDGSNKLNAQGQTIPAYSEETVKQFARIMTGWTFTTRPGETPRFPNPSYYGAPMMAVEAYHDTTSKTLLNGAVTPTGRTAEEDLDLAIANIKSHPNVAPFVAVRLIQRFTMGNPSGAYIQRVAQVFQSTGGELFPTVKAILTDTEADNMAPNQGKLKEPVLYMLSMLRALNATATLDNNLTSYDQNMGEDLWFAPSVFNYFSPFYRKNGIVAPEFQVNTPSVAINRVNFAYRATRNGLSSQVQIDLPSLEGLATDPPTLVEALNQALLNGGMAATMKTSVLNAVNATTDLRVRARNAAYLVAGSSQFQVEP